MRRLTSLIVPLALFLALATTPAGAQGPPGLSANATVFATGLNNPRGLRFGPDGSLYVAEAGSGGTTSTVGKCPQVVPPVGPYTGGPTSRISKISPQGDRATVVDGLPSDQTTAAAGSFVGGIADVDFVGTTLYALSSGGGCSHGFPTSPNGILKVNGDGTTTLVADLDAFQMGHPTAKIEPDDFEPDGTWYGMTHVGNNLYAVEPNHGEVDWVAVGSPTVTRLIDVSASQGHLVPTAIAVGPDGNYYVGNLFHFPVVKGDAHIYKITPAGQITVFASGLTAVLGVAFDTEGRLYALETSAGVPPKGPPVAPFSGRVVRVTSSGLVPVATGLMFPTAMTFGPDGKLYVSNFGFGGKPGDGQIVRIDVTQPLSTAPSSALGSVPSSLPRTGDGWLDVAVLASGTIVAVGLLLKWRLRRGAVQQSHIPVMDET